MLISVGSFISMWLVLELITKKITYLTLLIVIFLGNEIIIGDALPEARHLISVMYDRSDTSIRNMNELRQHVFARSKSDLRSLPPTEDAFLLHVKMCLLQIGIIILRINVSLIAPQLQHSDGERIAVF